MKKNFRAIAVFTALLCGLLGVYFATKKTPSQQFANPAVLHLLSMSLNDSDGNSQNLRQWENEFLVINFWATWCQPCVQEMPELSELQKTLSDQHVQILGIGIDSPSNIAEFANKYHIKYPLFAAGMEGTELATIMGNKTGGLPFTVLISRDHRIVKTYLGRLQIDELRAEIMKLNIPG